MSGGATEAGAGAGISGADDVTSLAFDGALPGALCVRSGSARGATDAGAADGVVETAGRRRSTLEEGEGLTLAEVGGRDATLAVPATPEAPALPLGRVGSKRVLGGGGRMLDGCAAFGGCVRGDSTRREKVTFDSSSSKGCAAAAGKLEL